MIPSHRSSSRRVLVTVLVRRPELHAHAMRIALAIGARYGAEIPADLREVLSFWLASERGLERAAQSLIDYAAALGITSFADPTPSPPRSR